MNSELLQLVDQGNSVITPTRNLAQRILDTYALQQFEQGLLSWPTPNVYSWYGWCQQLWDELIFKDPSLPRLLDKYESLLLWQQVIEASPYHGRILHSRSTARQVQAAYDLFQNWQISEIPEEVYLNVDAFAFKVWKESYELKLKTKNWLDSSCLPSNIAKHLVLIKDKINPTFLYAFDEITAQQKHLLQAVKDIGCEYGVLNPTTRNNDYSIQSYDDTKAELYALSSWIIQTHKKDPKARIGVVVSHLKSQREHLMHKLERFLCEENYYNNNSSTSSLPFAISSGKPLNDYPVINIALNILSLNAAKLDITTLSLLLRSPFITGFNKECSNRSRLHTALHKFGLQTLNAQQFLTWHEGLDHETQCPVFISALSKYMEIFSEQKNKQNISQWLPVITTLLDAFIWPGDRELNSDEFQTLSEWRETLEKLLSLNNISSEINYTLFLSTLTWICTQQSFQPRTESQTIEIIDIVGASGMQFDFLWLYGAHDQAWPQPYQVNPFLPISLQQQADIPSATANGRLQQSQIVYQSLVNSAEHVVASYAHSDGEQLLRPSPLLTTIENIQYQTPSLQIPQPEQGNLETIDDHHGTVLKKGQVVTGGTALFKDQAACPHRAFAKHRLYADSIPDIQSGISAIEKGNLIHRVLQLFWQKLKHASNLKRMNPDTLQDIVDNIIKQSCDELINDSDRAISNKNKELESQRMLKLMDDFITLEKLRESFTVIATEKGHHAIVNDIVLHLRIDRIDQLKDGSLVIIDYKSGLVTANAWEGDRPDDPQLPLYAITSNDTVTALLIARLKTGDTKYLGKTSAILGDIKLELYEPNDWSDKLNEWNEVLNKLANDFRNGEATVDPMPHACRFCDLSMLCRIHERLLNLEDIDNVIV